MRANFKEGFKIGSRGGSKNGSGYRDGSCYRDGSGSGLMGSRRNFRNN